MVKMVKLVVFALLSLVVRSDWIIGASLPGWRLRTLLGWLWLCGLPSWLCWFGQNVCDQPSVGLGMIEKRLPMVIMLQRLWVANHYETTSCPSQGNIKPSEILQEANCARCI
jgi:hypothetical protein